MPDSSSKLFDVLPLVRIPLTINVAVGLILSCLRVVIDYRVQAVGYVILIFYAISLAVNLVFGYSEFRKGAIRLTDKYSLTVPTVIVKALIDLCLAFTLVILHISNTIAVARDWGSAIFAMYTGIGALSARYASPFGLCCNHIEPSTTCPSFYHPAARLILSAA
jgi:type III secretory pathway component EscS